MTAFDNIAMTDTTAYPPLTIGYDIETFPNCFLFTYAWLGNPAECVTFEISFRRNDLAAFIEFLTWVFENSIEMVGFNNVGFDYPVVHFIWNNRHVLTIEAIYQKAMSIINSFDDRFANTIWERDRLAPQIDLFLIHHFNNKAKTQSLKGLEYNMRSASVQEMPVEPGTYLTSEQIDALRLYNCHDVRETIKFAWISAENVKLRRELLATLDGDVLNFNDGKIGAQMFIQRLGNDLCYERVNKRKVPRQTYRDKIVVRDILFPYIQFQQPEFRRVHQWLAEQVVTETKGVFSGLKATINGFDFDFGTGGIHGSVSRRAFYSDEDTAMIDVDVAALYPSIAIENKLYPAHLGPGFVDVYAGVRAERGKHAKGTSMNATFKLANNVPYGLSNEPHSPLFDPQFTLAITINGQLLLCTLAEWLLTVPTLTIIQINTDGVTFLVRRIYEQQVASILSAWEQWSKLKLEQARYSRMFIRDVNNYIAETEPDDKGKRKLKRKGAYEFYLSPKEISNASPSAWYKDMSAPVIQQAAVFAMLKGVPVETYIANHVDPFDFMLRAKVDRRSNLFIGEKQVQRITRYYVARNGAAMSKRSPPTGIQGAFKRKPKVSEYDYQAVMAELRAAGTPDAWDARIHTGNKSTYDERTIGFAAGWKVAECNVSSEFDWNNLDRAYYIEEARKLVIQ